MKNQKTNLRDGICWVLNIIFILLLIITYGINNVVNRSYPRIFLNQTEQLICEHRYDMQNINEITAYGDHYMLRKIFLYAYGDNLEVINCIRNELLLSGWKERDKNQYCNNLLIEATLINQENKTITEYYRFINNEETREEKLCLLTIKEDDEHYNIILIARKPSLWTLIRTFFEP